MGMLHSRSHTALFVVTAALVLIINQACSKPPQSSFRVIQKCESFKLAEVTPSQEKRSKVDLLFIVDNSGSMGDKQDALSAAFGGFTNKYLKPTREGDVKDLRIGVITTDTYYAGFNSTFPADFATFKPGYHDGIRPEIATQAPAPRSGRPILNTIPPSGAADTAYFSSLISAFGLNSKPGTKGSGNESGMSSVLAFMDRNEKAQRCSDASARNSGNLDPLCFFRADSLRVLIFFSDAEDNCKPTAATTGWKCYPGTERVARFKAEMDDYFAALDVNGKPNYLVVPLVSREDSGDMHLTQPTIAVQYEDLVAAVKQDAENPIGAFSYFAKLQTGSISELLDHLGASIDSVSSQRFSSFQLGTTPESLKNMNFSVVLPDGQRESVPTSVMNLQRSTLSLNAAFLDRFPNDAVLEGCYAPDATATTSGLR